ncbi:MAG TPA: replicative DNA helicase [Frankiaceae bacterium]|nr:replicative DNA helicase [Frankiaceae bacterium]
MLLSKDAIADVVEVLRAADFYRPAHGSVYEVVGDLYGRGEPADVISVAAELGRRELLGKVGGPAYLHTLISSVPTAANAGYYARIVAEKAVLRRLVEAGTRIVQLGYSAAPDVDEVVDRAQAAVYEVTERRTGEDYLRVGELLHPALEELEAIGSHDGTLTGVPTGFADLDELTNGLHAGQLWIVAARPAVGKSTLGLDLARSASIKHGMAAAFFSLEMSRLEITMRLLSAEARVSLQAMRTGRLSEDDWARLARRMGEVAGAPLFIDDSPHLTMMEVRAKARRLKQRHDLRLVVLDYLQLMSSPRRVENRQQEVSEISRSLKLLSKELDVPIVAISQLNRSPEQRADKRPQLSDLRESGCLTADTGVLRADTGARTTLGELLSTGERDVPVWSVDADLRLRVALMSHAFPSGVKEVFALRLRGGPLVKASANHRFLTPDGWRRLDELAVGAHVAVPYRVPQPPPALLHPVGGGVGSRPSPGGTGDRQGLVDRTGAGAGGQGRAAAVTLPRVTGDVAWDEVAGIDRLGRQPVYDATVPGTHSFIANGVVVHNSLEQDADAVILLYREDAFERESARAGEADLIVSKHRNGPTGTITVAFQGHYSRFVDMATS